MLARLQNPQGDGDEARRPEVGGDIAVAPRPGGQAVPREMDQPPAPRPQGAYSFPGSIDRSICPRLVRFLGWIDLDAWKLEFDLCAAFAFNFYV